LVYLVIYGDYGKYFLEAYKAILEASEKGANVSQLISRFNKLLVLARKGEAADIVGRLSSVTKEATILGEAAANAQLTYTIISLVSAVVLVGLLVVFYTRYRYSIWRLWVRVRGKHRVYPSTSARKSLLTDPEVFAVVLALIIVIGVFAIAQVYVSSRVVEPFSEIGLLGPKMKIGDYPTEVIVGEKFKLYIYLGNHMGYPMWYVVFLKIGNMTTFVNETVPANVEPVWCYEILLDHNSNITIPIVMSLNRTGTNVRLIFELWTINEHGELAYHNRWVHLWINVTKPTI